MTNRHSLNQATIKKAPLDRAVGAAVDAGFESIGLWRESVAEFGLKQSADLVRRSGLRVSTLCRAGFFTASDNDTRKEALDDNRRAISEAAELGAPVLVLVVGGLPPESRDLVGSRERVADAVGELMETARDAGVALAIEPLHPMFVSDRSVVVTLGQALDLAAPFPVEQVGVAIDTFNVFWDPRLFVDIARAGAERRILTFQVGDWLTPGANALLSRGHLGDGCIDFAGITRAVVEAGYDGDIETEIFNATVWEEPALDVARIANARFTDHVAPWLGKG